MQPQAPVYPTPPVADPQQPPRKSTLKVILIVLAALFGINVLSGAAFYVYNKSRTHNAPKTNDAIVTTVQQKLQQKPTLTAADVQAINKEDAFYAYTKKAAQQKKVVLTKAFYFSDDGTPKAEDRFSKVGVDYDTKQIVLAEESAYDGIRERTRCHDGVQDDYLGSSKVWERSSDASSCTKDDLYNEATDGFNAGGLTADQAETFVSYLRSHAGLLNVKNLQLADHQGKQYLHFTVTLNQIKVKNTHFAAQWLMFAFKQTGLDPAEHPYSYVGSGGEGFTLEYYVDPTTGLPAYSELTALASSGDGSGSVTGDYHYRMQYDFTTSTFDATPANNADIAITW